ncbi:MAG: A/G-specific adenine glycosylase [Burkholderiaceae bacterium]
MASGFAASLVDWQRRHGRYALPWQGSRDPYRVWLSEIMLQQTQVTTVLGYYARFFQRFPDVVALAAASLDDVFGLWSGLGYYSRARNLHRCTQAVVHQHGGSFPRSAAQLMLLPGIGRSTAAAIAVFCFGERVAILDGNVKRVLTRLLAFDGDLAESKHERELWSQATRLLPDRDIECYTQGLMDLGATLCTARAPSCPTCPVRGNCAAAIAGNPQRYPVKSRKLKRGTREHVWLWLQWRDQAWLEQRPATGVWAGLWSLPEFGSRAELDTASAAWPGEGESLPSFTHTLTHLDWTLHPVRWRLPDRIGSARRAALERIWPSGRWFGQDEALAAGLPAPVRKLLSCAGAALS